MEAPSIVWHIKSLNHYSPPQQISRIWNGILHIPFPPLEGFSTGHEVRTRSGKADPLNSNIIITTSTYDKKFLIVECKGAVGESQPELLDDTREQLVGLLERAANARQRAQSDAKS